MIPEARALLRAAAAVAAGVALVLVGIAIGANLGPRVVKVERRVVERVPASSRREVTPSGFGDVVDGACSAVAALRTTSAPDNAPPRRRRRGRDQRGDPARSRVRPVGFFISPDGYLLAPAQALGSGPVTVALNDGRELVATRVKADDLSGLALLKVEAANLSFLQFAAQTFPRVGDAAIAISSPSGTGCAARFALVGVDFLSEEPGLDAYVRLDPAPDAGLPGAPVLSSDGLVLGIAGLRAGGGDVVMPAEVADRVATVLLRGLSPPEQAAGLLADDLSPRLAARLGADRQNGAIALIVKPGGHAARAGLRAGDIILSVAGAPVSGASELGRLLDAQSTSVALGIVRQRRPLTLELDLPARTSG